MSIARESRLTRGKAMPAVTHQQESHSVFEFVIVLSARINALQRRRSAPVEIGAEVIRVLEHPKCVQEGTHQPFLAISRTEKGFAYLYTLDTMTTL